MQVRGSGNGLQRIGRYAFLALSGLAALGTLLALNNANHHVKLVAAKQEIERGSQITDSLITSYEVAGTTIPEGTISWDDRSTVLNHLAVEKFYPLEPLRRERLMAADGKGFAVRPADAISSAENRLYCIPVDTSEATSSLGLQSGDYIDVIGTFNSLSLNSANSPKGTDNRQNTANQSNLPAQIDTMVSHVIIQHAYILKISKNCAQVEVNVDLLPDLTFLKQYGQLTIALARPDEIEKATLPMTAQRFFAKYKIPTDNVPPTVGDLNNKLEAPFTKDPDKQIMPTVTSKK